VLNKGSLLEVRRDSFFSTKLIKANRLHGINGKPTKNVLEKLPSTFTKRNITSRDYSKQK